MNYKKGYNCLFAGDFYDFYNNRDKQNPKLRSSQDKKNLKFKSAAFKYKYPLKDDKFDFLNRYYLCNCTDKMAEFREK